MITEITHKQASNISDTAKFSGKKLCYKPGSIANTLSSAIGPYLPGSDIMQVSSMDQNMVTTHEMAEIALAEQMAKTLGMMIDIAKNTLSPICKETIDYVSNRIIDTKKSLSGTDYKLVMYQYPLLFGNKDFLYLVNQHQNANNVMNADIQNTINEAYLVFSNEEKKDLTNTGIMLLDKHIDSYLSGIVSVNGYPELIDGCSLNSGIIAQVAAFLTIVNILNGKTDKTNIVNSTTSDQANLLNARSILGRAIVNKITMFDAAVKRGELLANGNYIPVSVYTDDRTIVVHADAYKKWIGNGGSWEALEAFMHDTKDVKFRNIAPLLTDPAKYSKMYDDKVGHVQQINMLNEPRQIKSAVTDVLRRRIAEDDSLDNKKAFQDRLTVALTNNVFYAGSPIDTYIISVVCDTYLHDCNVRDIKRLMIERANVIKTMDIPDNDAAIQITLVRVITAWLGEQILVTTVGN